MNSHINNVSVDADPILHRGDSGAAVTELQSLLNSHGAHVASDGMFTSSVLTAVVSFQQRKGLIVDGIVGPQTWQALKRK